MYAFFRYFFLASVHEFIVLKYKKNDVKQPLELLHKSIVATYPVRLKRVSYKHVSFLLRLVHIKLHIPAQTFIDKNKME